MTPAVLLVVTAAVLLWPAARTVPTASGRTQGAGPLVGRVSGLRAALRGRGHDGVADLAEVAETIAMALRAGATPARAVAVAAQDASPTWSALLAEVAERLGQGYEAGGVWQRAARDRPEVGFLAGAWALSERLGSPLAPTMATAAEVMRGRLAVRRRIDAASAGPRATMVMLTVLPVAGLCAGLAFGLAPWEVVTHSRASGVSVAVGAVLTLTGWWLCRTVLRRALREEVWR